MQRLIFYQEPSNWDIIETKHLKGFHKWIETNRYKLPDDFPQ